MTTITEALDAFVWSYEDHLCVDCSEFESITRIDDKEICCECLVKYHQDAIDEMVELIETNKTVKS